MKRALTIFIAGDRGLAGGYNANVIRALAKHVREVPAEHSAIAVGRRAAAHVARARGINQIAAYDVENGNAADIAIPILAEAIRQFTEGEVDRVDVITTEFVSTVSQKVSVEQLLPVALPEGGGTTMEATMEPGPEELVELVVRRVLEAEVVQAILEARASEQAARMVAMMNATDNADEITADLTLVYNNARQSGITQQLTEISAGAEAIAK